MHKSTTHIPSGPERSDGQGETRRASGRWRRHRKTMFRPGWSVATATRNAVRALRGKHEDVSMARSDWPGVVCCRAHLRSGVSPPALLFQSFFFFHFFSHDFRFLSPVRPSTTRFGISSRPHGRTRHLESGGLCGDLDLLGQGYSRAASLGDLSLYFISCTVDKIRYHCGLKGQLHTNI